MTRRILGALASVLLALGFAAPAFAVALTVTAASVSLDSGPRDADQGAGEAFTAGAAVYLRASDNLWLKAKSNGTAEQAGAVDIGIALSTADAAGARVSIGKAGAVLSFGTGTAGVVYVLGTTAGTLVPTADLATTNKATIAAIGIGSSKLMLTRVYNAGAVVP